MHIFNRCFLHLCLLGLLCVSASAVQAASEYAGEYSGTFSVKGSGKINDAGDTIPDQDGTLKITVDADGKITGTADNKQLKLEGKVKGTISEDGDISVTIKYPEMDATTVKGSVTSPKGGRLKGTLSQEIGQATMIVKINLSTGKSARVPNAEPEAVAPVQDGDQQPTVEETVKWLADKIPHQEYTVATETSGNGWTGENTIVQSIDSFSVKDGTVNYVTKNLFFARSRFSDGGRSTDTTERVTEIAVPAADLNPESIKITEFVPLEGLKGVTSEKKTKFSVSCATAESKAAVSYHVQVTKKSSDDREHPDISTKEGQSNSVSFTFDDEETAKRVAKALKHLLVKSGAVGKKEPF